MRRFFQFISISAVILLLSAWTLSIFLLPQYLKELIETKGGPAVGGKMTVSAIKVVDFYPFTLRFQNLVINSPDISGSISEIDGGIGFSKVVFILQNAHMAVMVRSETKDSKATTPTEKKQNLDIPAWASAFGAEIEVKDSRLSILGLKSEADFKNTNIKIEIPSVREVMKVTFSTRASVLEGFFVPITAQTDLQVQDNVIVLKQGSASIFALQAQISGNFNLKNQAYDFLAKMNVSDLAKIPLPKDVQIKKWAGAVSAEARAWQKESSAPVMVGKFFADKLKIEPQFKNKNIEVDGLAEVSSSGDFKFDKTLAIDNLKWNANLSQLKTKYSNLVEKPAGVSLLSSGEMSMGSRLNIKSALLQFDQLILESNGIYDARGPSDFRFNLKPTPLKGLEKYFIPLKDYPLEGNVESKGKISGDFSKPETVGIQLESVLAKGVRAKLVFKNDKVKMNGLVSVDINGKLQVQGRQLVAGAARAGVDVSGMDIEVPNIFLKKAGQILKFDVDAGKVQNDFLIKKGSVQTFFGNFEVSGQPPLSLKDKMNIRVSSGGVNLKTAATSISDLAKFVKAGTVKMAMGIQGKYNSENFWTSPMIVSGDIEVDLPEYRMAAEKLSAKSMATPKGEPEPPKDVPAFLPDSELVRGLNLNLKARLGLFGKEDLIAKSIAVTAKIANKNLSISSGSVGEIFGGTVALKNILVPLTVVNPKTQMQADFTNLDVGQTLGFINPQWKELAKGRISGDVRGKSYLPSTPLFLDELSAEGKFNLTKGILSTVNFETLVKEKLSEIPGAGNLDLQRGPLQADADGTYVLEKKVLRLTGFHAITPRKEEMQVTGLVGMDMSVDLKGQVSLVDWPGGGSIYEANKDDKGRITVPINIVGNALNPELSFAGDTIKQMLAKVAEYELKKKRKGLEEDLKKDLEDKLKNFLKK